MPRTDKIDYNQPWRTIYAAVLETLIRQVPTDGSLSFASEDELGFLAEHITDDLVQLSPSIPPNRWRP